MSEPHYPGHYPEWFVEECRKHATEQTKQVEYTAAIVQRKLKELGMSDEQGLPEVDMDDVIPFDRGVEGVFLSRLLDISLRSFDLQHIELSPTDAEAIRRAAAVIQAVLKREVRFKGKVR